KISLDCDISLSPFKTIDRIELSQILVADTTTIQASPYCQIIESTKAFAFTFKLGEFRFNSGNNAYNTVSIWKIDEGADETTIMQRNTNIVNELQAHSSHYHTPTMRKNYFCTCNLILPSVKSAALRIIY
ncbi:696_t:CDS:2, partial [Gigaspora rosea]